MKIGIFDSGLGGLYLLRAISKKLPQYDYIYLGDTKNLPYGEKNQKQIYSLTSKAMDFLFNIGCGIIIIACNTSSSQALRLIQKKYLPKYFPNKKVLGVIRPTVEVIGLGDTCVIATSATIKSHAYLKELKKINPKKIVHEISAPELVDLIEASDIADIKTEISKYAKLISNKKVVNLILGCTHYAVIKDQFAKELGGNIKLISQDEVLPEKLHNYLYRHQEIENILTRNKSKKFFVTKLNMEFERSAKKWFGKKIKLELATL